MRTAEFIGTLADAQRSAEEAKAGAEITAELRRLWVATLKHDWRALAVIPAAGGSSAAEVARGLYRVGLNEAGVALRFVNGTGADLASTTRMAAEVREVVAQGGRVVIVVDPPAQAEAAVPLALCADAVVLGIELGRTTRRDVEETVDELGGAKVIGSVLIEGEA